ncbi:protein canopy homolog 4-like [Penaeus japonicus]|uniref:protein canopy homolog 4-like n=1 Tax=Penaeus japonicus TaxID=27405 RepID=UPI001C712B2F|nr:protein canopy homolog 4-like [Penaeus japonicus]
MALRVSIFLLLGFISVSQGGKNIEEDQYGVRYATDCEVCKLVMKELGEKLQSKDSSSVIETGYNIDASKKKTKYNKSELRLVETLEEVCPGMLDYRVHKEREDSTRWAKKMSQTFQTLHNLVNKGVKVDLGIPMELWDEPSAEVTHLKTQCEQFIEDYEDDISDWYFGDQAISLQVTVCKKVLKEKKCLSEPYGEDITSEEQAKEKEGDKKKLKGDRSKTRKNEL